jgi:beta-phosphoglucomutase-like phosphatase (HAD superfamily)
MIIPRTIKAIAWDLDGTLLDSFLIFSKLISDIAPEFTVPAPSREAMQQAFHGTLREAIEAVIEGLDAGQFDDFERRFLTDQGKYYLQVDDNVFADAAQLMRQAGERGIKQLIVTNRDHANRGTASPRSIVENSFMKPLVDVIISGDEVGEFRKPDARVFGNSLIELGVSPEEVLVIGDQHVDALLALNLGASGVIVIRNGETMTHAHTLPHGWQKYVTEVKSLHDVRFA